MKNNILITANLDEISDDIKIASDFFVKNKLELVEVRTINKKNIVDYSLKEVKFFANYLKKRKLKVAAIASPLFKWYLNKPNKKLSFDSFYFNPILTDEEKKKYITKTLDIAEILETNIIRIFSNLKLNNLSIPDVLSDKNFIFALEEAKKRKISLALENEPICPINDIGGLREVVKKFKGLGLKLWFDIANFYQLGEQVTKEDLINLRNEIIYFHIKDFVKELSKHKYVPLGEGDLNYKRLISDIRNVFDKKKVILSLETHVKENKIEATQKSLDSLRKLISNKRVKYAIVGNGNIFKKHMEAMRVNDNSELRGFYDILKNKSIAASKKYDGIYYPTLESLLKDTDVDVVNICTPHNTHIKIALDAVKHNKKVLCEKPFALSMSQLNTVLKNEKACSNIHIVLQNNFNSAIKYLYNLIEKNKLGNLKQISINLRWWRDDKYFADWHGKKKQAGGILFNQAIHSLSVINRITKLEIKRVHAFCKQFRKNSEVEDIILAIFELKNGVLGNIEASVYTKSHNMESSILAVGDKGSIKIGGSALSTIEYLDIDEKILYKKELNENSEKNIYGEGHIKLINTLSDYYLGNKLDKERQALLVRPKELTPIIRFIEKIYDSCKFNKL